MMHSNSQNNSFRLKLWQPFSNLSIYGKFVDQAKETGRNRVIRFVSEMWDSSDY